MAESDLKPYPEHFDVDFSSLENLMELKRRHNEIYLDCLIIYQKFLNDTDKTINGPGFIEFYKQVVQLRNKIQKATEYCDGDESLRLITNMMRRDGDEYLEQEEQCKIDIQIIKDE
jgi:hypothetical protein